jgi:hypothetical protein
LDPTTETPTSSLLRRTTKPNPRLAQPDLASDRVVLSNSLRVYIRHAWHVVEPSTVYLENWHIDLIAEYLEAVTAGQIKRLLINMPPRYAKSTCVSIMWPTWVWAREGFPGKPHNPVLEGPGTGCSHPTPMSSAPSIRSIAANSCNPTGIARAGRNRAN